MLSFFFRMENKVKLNVGCGYDKKPGWINTDLSNDVNPDVVWDIEKKSGFKDNGVDEIYIRHAFQYSKNPVGLLKELYRICRNGALITIIVPHGNSYQDNLFHNVIGFNIHSFDRFHTQHRSYYDLPNLKIQEIICRAAGVMKVIPFKRILSKFLNNIYYEIEYKLVVIK